MHYRCGFGEVGTLSIEFNGHTSLLTNYKIFERQRQNFLHIFDLLIGKQAAKASAKDCKKQGGDSEGLEMGLTQRKTTEAFS